ncbi:hypothetical protein FGRMN_10696 [Fusarium graminum]|nr:hypothetical protein FGRMN_10696 [Fusarium graminum]
MRAELRGGWERLRKKQNKSPVPRQSLPTAEPSRVSSTLGGSELQIPHTSPSSPSVAPDVENTSNGSPDVNLSVNANSVPPAATIPEISITVSICPQVCPPANPTPQYSPGILQTPKPNHQSLLWDRAYDELKSQETELVNAYEKLLSAKADDVDAVPNENTTNNIETLPQKRCSQMRKVAELGLEKTKRSTAIHEKINGAMEIVYPLKKLVDQIVPVIPQAAVPWAGISLAFEIFANPFKEPGINRDGLMYVISMMNWYTNLPEPTLDDDGSEMQEHLRQQLEDHILELYQKLLSYQIKSVCCFYKNGLSRFLRNVIKLDDWKSQIDAIDAAEARLLEDIKSSRDQSMVDELQKQSEAAKTSYQELRKIASLIHREIYHREARDHEVDNRECRKHLYLTDPSRDKERILESKGALLRESYSWIIDHPAFQDWQTNSQHRRLWIKGGPGKGKTMLLCGIIEELEKNPFSRLCYFFCQATEEKLSNAEAVLRGLMYHLVIQYPWLITHVRGLYDNSGENGFVDHNSWVTLCKIFESMLGDERLDQVTIVIDALDECLGNRPKLLKLIQRISAGSRAKLIVSSRPSQDIEGLLENDGEHAKTLPLELNDDLISNAVESFIDTKVRELTQRGPYNKDKTVCKMVRNYLIKNASNTFLWVALVCQELSSWKISRKDHVEKVLEQSPPGLNELYSRMLDSIEGSLDQELYKEILTANSVVKRPVTLGELLLIINPKMASKLDLSQLQGVVGLCGSFLLIQNDVVYFMHQSAVDFLRNTGSPRLPSLLCRHQSIFENSLHALQISKKLKRDIYGLECPGVAWSDINPPEDDPLVNLHYSCVYWVDHLCALMQEERQEPTPGDQENVSKIFSFLKSKFLFWIEAFSLLGHTHEAVLAVLQLEKLMVSKSSLANQELSEFVHDANRFILYYREVIESHPLQLYAAALVFSPQQSVVRNSFRDEAPRWVDKILGLEPTWEACLQTLVCYRNLPFSVVPSLAYSADGQWLAAAFGSGAMELWHADSGTCMYTVVVKDDVECRSFTEDFGLVAFLADGRSLVSGSRYGTVKVWNLEDGSCVSEHQAHSCTAHVTTISSDGCTFAYIIDEDILIWSMKDEIPSRKWENVAALYSPIALSADGQWLASTSEHCIVLRNTSTGESEQIITVESKVSSLSFSSDSQWIASSGRFTHIWERKAGQWKLKVTCEVDGEQVDGSCLTFSSENKFLAAHDGFNINVWDTATGVVTRKVVYPYCHPICFSPDSRKLVSATGGNVKIWDLSTDQEGISPGHERGLYKLDRDSVVEHSYKAPSIKLWNTADDETYMEFNEVNVTSVAISKEHHILGSVSDNRRIKIWDIRTGAIVQELHYQKEDQTDDDDYGSSAIGAKSYFATSSRTSVKVWDMADGHCVSSFDNCGKRCEHMKFSNDARWMACAWEYYDAEYFIDVDIWDTATWRPVSKVSRLRTFNLDLSFSADGQRLVISAKFNSAPHIYVYEVGSGTVLRQFRADTRFRIMAAFDNKLPRRLHTQYGYFDIPHRPDTALYKEEAMPPFCGYGLSTDESWILLDGSRLLWIPQEYRRTHDSLQPPIVYRSSVVFLRERHDPLRITFIPTH